MAVNVSADADPDDVLRLAASLDQASKHIIAQTIVAEAQNRQLKLAIPSDVVETAGEGVQGVIEGRSVAVGGIQFVMSKLPQGTENHPPASKGCRRSHCRRCHRRPSGGRDKAGR